MHLSTKDEVNMLAEYMYGDVVTRQISAEACIPHLCFSDFDYQRKGAYLKCNPSVKYEIDRRALVNGLEGIITTVATDHAPHEKAAKEGTYFKCASGLPSVQFSLQSLLELYKQHEITLETIAKVTSTNVAKRFHIKDRGAIKEGYFADLAIVNLSERNTVCEDDIASKCKWSPFTGETFSSKIVHTIVNGELVVKDSKIVSDAKGMALEFDR